MAWTEAGALVFRLIKEFKWSLSEIGKLNVTTASYLQECLVREYQEKKRAAKKARRRRR